MIKEDIGSHLIGTDQNKGSAFFIVDLEQIQRKILRWILLLNRVIPYYAIKCNPDRRVLKEMISLGMSFDCASKGEVSFINELYSEIRDEQEKSKGPKKIIDPPSIVFANPMKTIADLECLKERKNIQWTTFETYSELEKIKKYSPKVKCLLRIKIDNPDARINLSKKYGAEVYEILPLLKKALELGISVEGVAFHVGSYSTNSEIFYTAIAQAHFVFQIAKPLGINMKVLDIGGGFIEDTFAQCATVINRALNNFFPETRNDGPITIIAEPGRYFVEKVFALFIPIIGVKRQQRHYYVEDSLYGSFNCIHNDQQTPIFKIIRVVSATHNSDESENKNHTLYFQTCDSEDKLENVLLPENLEVGDYLMIENHGAYTIAGSSNFNGMGFDKPRILYY